jgi:hypothetical protein
MGAQLTLAEGEKLTLTGFQAINREKLKAIPIDQLEALLKSDELELAYIHLQSMRNFTAMLDKITANTDENSVNN